MNYPPHTGLVDLKLERADSQLVRQGKDTLNRVLTFEIACHDGKELWHPFFGSNGDSHWKLRDLEKKLGVVVEADMRQCQLRLYGPPEKRREATGYLSDAIQELSKTAQSIVLNNNKHNDYAKEASRPCSKRWEEATPCWMSGRHRSNSL